MMIVYRRHLPSELRVQTLKKWRVPDVRCQNQDAHAPQVCVEHVHMVKCDGLSTFFPVCTITVSNAVALSQALGQGDQWLDKFVSSTTQPKCEASIETQPAE